MSPLALLSDRNEIVQRQVLRSAVRGTKWGLHADVGGGNEEMYQSLGDNLFASIRIAESHQEKKNQMNNSANILYVGQ